MFTEVKSLEEFQKKKEHEPAILAYFSTGVCTVCKVLKPKLAAFMQNEFPECKLIYIPSDKFPEIAAQNRVFAAPTILVYFEGRETIRKSRNIGISELRREIARPYSLIFGGKDADRRRQQFFNWGSRQFLKFRLRFKNEVVAVVFHIASVLVYFSIKSGQWQTT